MGHCSLIKVWILIVLLNYQLHQAYTSTGNTPVNVGTDVTGISSSSKLPVDHREAGLYDKDHENIDDGDRLQNVISVERENRDQTIDANHNVQKQQSPHSHSVSYGNNVGYTPFKHHKFDIPLNGKNVGTHNDERMRKFKPVSSHGRDDVFGGEDRDETAVDTNKLILRALLHLWNFSPVLITLPLAYLSSYFRSYLWYALIRSALGRGGAAFIKWGQWSSTRPDIFPEELCTALAQLQTNSPEHSFEFTRKSILEEFGEPIEDIFDFFDDKPIASGSIAQIYRGILRGREVAIKVRHPNVYEQIKMDFTIMKFIANTLDKIPAFQWLNLPESTSQFSGTIASQTKLDVEGRHLVLFNRYFKTWNRVVFPRPIMFTDAVLIESFEHGETVSSFAKRIAKQRAENIKISQSDAELSRFIVTIGEDIYLKMLIQDNLMHADLHPGNILIQYFLDGVTLSKSDYIKITASSDSLKDKIETRVVLVDAGMVACLTQEERSNFIGLLESVGDGDGDRAADFMLQFSAKQIYSRETIRNFKSDVRELFRKICRGYGTNVQMGEVLRGILALVRIHQVTIAANYATLFLNVLCLDGLANSLIPSYNVLDGAKNLLQLHKFSRNLEFPLVHDAIIKAGLPIARWLKRRYDEAFFKRKDFILR